MITFVWQLSEDIILVYLTDEHLKFLRPMPTFCEPLLLSFYILRLLTTQRFLNAFDEPAVIELNIIVNCFQCASDSGEEIICVYPMSRFAFFLSIVAAAVLSFCFSIIRAVAIELSTAIRTIH